MYIVVVMITDKKPKTHRNINAIDYAIIASMLSVVIIIALEATGLVLNNHNEEVSAKLQDAYEAASGGRSSNLQYNPDAP